MDTMKQMTLDQLTSIARKSVRAALSKYEVPPDFLDSVVLGTYQEGEKVIFELYEPGDSPQDAIVYTETVMNPYTGEHETRVFHLTEK
jgi:hypothetical protein